jgi:glutathione S-transferase
MRRLITISISHYCEKARWALDRAGMEYTEEGHFPNAHYLASFRVARTPFVPILVDGGRVIPDSTAILHHVDGFVAAEARLFPDGPSRGEVARLEERFDETLGPPARVWAYWHWFERARETLHYAGYGAPRVEQVLVPVLFGLLRRLTSWRLAVDADHAERSLRRVRETFDEVGGLLSDGRRFLAGDRFTAADLTFAALAAPVEAAPPAMRAEIERLRATRAGAFALRLYAEERRSRSG